MITRSHLIAAIAVTALLSSCTLSEDPRDQISEEEVYTTPKAIFQHAIASLYSYVGGHEDGQGLQGTFRGVHDLQTFGSDEALIPTRGGDWYDGGLWQDMYKHSWNAGHEIHSKSWTYLYKVITLCNRSLETIEAHDNVLTDEQKRQYISEVRALRAIYYWYLLDIFGRVPIITAANLSLADVHQSERSEVFRFVFKELNDVARYLPSNSSVRHDDYYARVTMPVVIFVLAKLMINAEIYADDNWTDGVYTKGEDMVFSINGSDMNAWEAAILYCELLRRLGYLLEDNYETNFAVRNENSRENIWVIAMDKDLYTNQMQDIYRSYHYRHAAAYGFGGENGTCATKKVLEVFGYATPYQDNRFAMNYWYDAVYDLDSIPVYDRKGNLLIYRPEKVELDLTGSKYIETAGARMRKYEIDKNATADGKLMDNDIVLFRYADVLLMRAEALMRLGRSDEGKFYFDLVRERAGMEDIELNEQNLFDERLRELCWEGWRRQDMIRFRKYESLYDGPGKVDESDGHTIVFPIPSKVIDQNPQIRQNPGY